MTWTIWLAIACGFFTLASIAREVWIIVRDWRAEPHDYLIVGRLPGGRSIVFRPPITQESIATTIEAFFESETPESPPMPTIINIADLIDPSDPQGRSYRQINAEKRHAIPIGTLVERTDGVRLWVVCHNRDCDETPFYSLCADRDDTEQEHKNFANSKWVNGWADLRLGAILIESPDPRSRP